MTTKHITIGPEFFAKAANDYNDWHWAIIREFMQNSIDCGSKRISISVETKNGRTWLTVNNDGEPMSKSIITDKLLSLGSSGKPDREEGNIGGFGKAKEILYFMHRSYSIESGGWYVKGSGGSYEIFANKAGSFNGTSSSVEMDGDQTDELIKAANKFAAMTQWSGTLVINDEVVDCKLRKGSRRKELSFGVIYSNRTYSNKFIVRINGTPMFYDWISYDGCIIVELTHDSLDCLTSNRDSLKGQYRNDLMGFVNELAADKQSALRDSKPKYTHYEGKQFVTVKVKQTTVVSGSNREKGTEAIETPKANDMQPTNTVAAKMNTAASEAEIETEHDLEFDFVIKNETGMTVPDHFTPENMGNYARKLLQNWAMTVLKMHEVLGMQAEFSIGFIFSEDCEAQYEVGPYGTVYYINPAEIVEQTYSKSRSFSKRFKLTEKDRLIMIALHEAIHGKGYSYHDERFANVLTDNAVIVMKNRKKFNQCFR